MAAGKIGALFVPGPEPGVVGFWALGFGAAVIGPLVSQLTIARNFENLARKHDFEKLPNLLHRTSCRWKSHGFTRDVTEIEKQLLPATHDYFTALQLSERHDPAQLCGKCYVVSEKKQPLPSSPACEAKCELNSMPGFARAGPSAHPQLPIVGKVIE